MVLLVTLDNPRLAQGFSDYLTSIGITNQLQAHSAMSISILVSEVDLRAAQEELKAFLQNPHHDKYSSASWQVGTTESGLVYSGKKLNLFTRFLKLNWLIQSVSLVSTLIYIGFMFGGFSILFEYLQFTPTVPHTWLSPALTHFSAMHLIFNLMWWIYLGNKIHLELGLKALVTVFIVTSITSHWAQFLMVDANFGGLSGVVYGVLGFCWLYGHNHPYSQLKMQPAVVGFMLIWLVFGFMDLLFISMANWAHLGGLLSGMLLGVIFSKLKKAA